MNTYELIRFCYAPDFTFSYLYLPEFRVCVLEEPWVPDPDGPGGQRMEPGLHESCVPDGIYDWVPHSGTKYQNVWRLENPALGVYAPGQKPRGQKWGREAILSHNGNVLAHTEGCQLVGLSHVYPAQVKDSRLALDRMRAIIPAGPHKLVIRPTTGTGK